MGLGIGIIGEGTRAQPTYAVTGEEYNAMLKRKAAAKAVAEAAQAQAKADADAVSYANMHRTELGLRYSVVRQGKGGSNAVKSVRGQSLLCKYTLSVGGFPGDEVSAGLNETICTPTTNPSYRSGLSHQSIVPDALQTWEKVDGSTGFMKPPGGFGFYAGVGQAIFLGQPVVGFDLTIMDMVPGEARRVVRPTMPMPKISQ